MVVTTLAISLQQPNTAKPPKRGHFGDWPIRKVVLLVQVVAIDSQINDSIARIPSSIMLNYRKLREQIVVIKLS